MSVKANEISLNHFIEKELTVTDDFIGQSKLKRGDVICKINGAEVDDLVKQYTRVISASEKLVRMSCCAS